MKGLKDVPKEEKPAVGKLVNDLRAVIEGEISAVEKVLKDKEFRKWDDMTEGEKLMLQ